MKWPLITVAFLVFFSSCRKGDVSRNASTRVDTVSAVYLFSNEAHLEAPMIGGRAHLTYKDNKIVRRNGGYLTIPTSGGYGSSHTFAVYDTVEYRNNTITLTTKDSSELLNVNPYKVIITVADDLIQNKITVPSADYPQRNDTLLYFYDNNKRLIRSEQYFSSSVFTRLFSYDSKGNLVRIDGERKRTDGIYANIVSEYTIEEFSNYDDRSNPLKGIFLWDDFFYRGLSVNNCARYTYKKYSAYTGQLLESRAYNWTLLYDGAGNLILSKP